MIWRIPPYILFIALAVLASDASAQLRLKCPGARTLCAAPTSDIATMVESASPINVLIDNIAAQGDGAAGKAKVLVLTLRFGQRFNRTDLCA